MKNAKKILLDKEDRQKLMEHFEASKQVVSLALLFKRNSLLSQRIRVYAMNHFDYAEVVSSCVNQPMQVKPLKN